MNIKKIRNSVTLACVGLAALTACSDSTGPDSFGQASVVLTSDAVAASTVGSGISLSLGDVPSTALANLFLGITRVDLHRVGTGDESTGEDETSTEGGEWISLEISLEAPLDLLAIPSTGGVVLAAGSIPAGRYNQARFFFDVAEAVLDEAVAVPGQTVDPGTYGVTVPSAAQTGLKLHLADTEVVEGETETIGLELATSATIGTLVWQANGFLLSPVLNAR